ncbi:MAG TPA: Ig-like domain-containing protein, partial [Gemmatimonadaceae bacterium]
GLGKPRGVPLPLRIRTAILFCLAAIGCSSGGGVTGPPAIATLSVALAQPTIVIGTATTATATARDGGGNILTGRAITWSSDNSTVATVSEAGLVTAVSTGTASITATSEGATGWATVTVTVQPVATVVVSLGSPTMAVGATTQATATLKDANGVILTGRTVTWASDNPGIATVTSNGVATAVVTGVGPGSTSITATSEGRTGLATVTVFANPVASVTVSFISPTIGVGKTTQALVTLRDANGTVLTGRALTFSSDNPTVATVSQTGAVTGVALGSANISATAEGQSGSAVINVAPQLGYGSSSEKLRILDVGGTFTPTLSGSSTGTTTFVSRATTVATVDAQGTITSVGAGQVWIAASAPGWNADSVYVIVPRNSTGPLLRTDLTTFNVKAGSTVVINVMIDTRSTPIGGTELTVGFTTVPTIFTGGSYTATGSPAPVISNLQAGLLRVSLASGSPLTGQLPFLQLSLNTGNANASGFLTLTFIDLVAPDGTDLIPVATSMRIPIIIQ